MWIALDSLVCWSSQTMTTHPRSASRLENAAIKRTNCEILNNVFAHHPVTISQTKLVHNIFSPTSPQTRPTAHPQHQRPYVVRPSHRFRVRERHSDSATSRDVLCRVRRRRLLVPTSDLCPEKLCASLQGVWVGRQLPCARRCSRRLQGRARPAV